AGQALITHSFGSLRSMRIRKDVGTRMPVSRTAAGYLLSPSHVRRQSAEVTASGYAIAIERSHREASAIATPVTNQKGMCVAALGLTLPTQRLLNARDTLVSLVCASAATLTHRLLRSDT